MELQLVSEDDNFYKIEFNIASAQITIPGEELLEFEFYCDDGIEQFFSTLVDLEYEENGCEIILFSETEDEDTIYQSVVFPIDYCQGFIATMFFDELNLCTYIPFNEKYKDCQEDAPVLVGGKNSVSKVNTFDDVDSVWDFFKHIIVHEKAPIDSTLKWLKA